MAVVSIAPQEHPPPFADCGSCAGAGRTEEGDHEMGLKKGFVQKALSLLRGNLTHLWWGKEGQMEWESMMRKICARSGYCMPVGFSETLRIYSSCCHKGTVLTLSIFNFWGKSVCTMAYSIFCVATNLSTSTHLGNLLSVYDTYSFEFCVKWHLVLLSRTSPLLHKHFFFLPLLFLCEKTKTTMLCAGIIDSGFLQNSFLCNEAET